MISQLPPKHSLGDKPAPASLQQQASNLCGLAEGLNGRIAEVRFRFYGDEPPDKECAENGPMPSVRDSVLTAEVLIQRAHDQISAILERC
jgi:hypothetical protein